MRIARYQMSVDVVPVDFFADPDGMWDFSSLVAAAGFVPEDPAVCVGALTVGFEGHPAGAAVVTQMAGGQYIAIVECPAVGGAMEASRRLGASASRVAVNGEERRWGGASAA